MIDDAYMYSDSAGACTSSSKIIMNISMKFPPMGIPAMLRHDGEKDDLLRFKDNPLKTSLLLSDRIRLILPLATFE